MLTSVRVCVLFCFFSNLFPTVKVWTVSSDWMLVWNLLVLKQTQKHPELLANSGMLLFDIFWALDGFNKQGRNSFKLCVFCKCFLLCFLKMRGERTIMVFQKKETPVFKPRNVRGKTKISAFQDEEAFPGWGGGARTCLHTPWDLLAGMSRNLELPEARSVCQPPPTQASCGISGDTWHPVRFFPRSSLWGVREDYSTGTSAWGLPNLFQFRILTGKVESLASSRLLTLTTAL